MPKRPSFSSFQAALAALYADPTPVCLEMPAWHAWVLFAQLQLALRHPGQGATTRAIAERIARSVEAGLLDRHPGLAELAAAGWRPELDEPITGGRR